MSKPLTALGVTLALCMSSCTSLAMGGKDFGTKPMGQRLTGLPQPVVGVVSSTLKVLKNREPVAPMESSVRLDAARGEGESSQILVFAGVTPIDNGGVEASVLVGPDGYAIEPDLGVVGYVPLTKPTVVGFWVRGDYPDPIIPASSFTVEAGRNQALWYTVWVPRNAPAGVYSGTVSVSLDSGNVIMVPVSLTVHDVTLPITSFLKTSIVFRKENIHDERYYGDAWTQDMTDELPFIGLRYRFSHRVDLPLMEALEPVSAGTGPAVWDRFDTAVEYWLAQGITCFELKLPIRWPMEPAEIRKDWAARLAAVNAHIVERGWTDLFYYYFYDEPFPRELDDFKSRLDAIREFSPDIPNILTYGITTKGQKTAAGSVGIWVPNIHQFDAKFAKTRQALGEQYWIYTCIGNSLHPHPDNFRIDWHGAAHRALGWWLFKYDIDGYLYWGVDLWRRNPWETTATFPWTNGDGMMFYPALDDASPIYPSTRVHLMRDAFEDFDLLTMLERLRDQGAFSDTAYSEQERAELERLLSVDDVIPSPSRFERDDRVYDRLHRRLLELLAARAAPAQ